MALSDHAHFLAKRRSTRVAADVYMGVRGVDRDGQPFLEQRWTLEVSFHGCKFYSRYALPKNSWLTIEIPNKVGNAASQPFRARVAWLSRSPVLRGLFQVGVEFEVPGNLWGLANPPEDWRPREVPQALDATGPGPAAFASPVHGMIVSNDGLVYVTDRNNRRFQVFTTEGKFIKEVFINRAGPAKETASGFALSPDKDQQFLYTAD